MRTDKQDISHLNGHDFEDLVEQLIKKMGFVVEERKLTADGGVDIFAKNYEPIFEGIYVIQCKRYTHKVGESIVRDLYGVVHSKNANKGILITNSAFSKKARDFAQNKQLELIDGERLRSLLIKYEIAKPHEGTVVLPNYALFLRNNFVPALRKIQGQVEDIVNKRVYIEKRMCDSKRWIELVLVDLDNLESYATSITNILNQSLTPACLKDDMQQVNRDCGKIIDATKKFVDEYNSVLGIIPPQKFSTVHDKFMAVYPSILDTIFRFTDDIEKATTDPKPQGYQISLVFPDKEIREVATALKEVKRETELSQQKKSWWL